MKAKWTVIVVSIIEVITIVVNIVYDIFVTTMVPNDDHVPGSQEQNLYLPPLPAGRSSFDVHGAINTHQVWILLYQCACL